MNSFQTREKIRDFLERLAQFIPDDLLIEILEFYGLRNVLAYTMNPDNQGPGTNKIKQMLGTEMGIEYVQIPGIYDNLMFNSDNQRVYGLVFEFLDFGAMDLEITSLSRDIKKEVHKASYEDRFDTLSLFFTNEELYFGADNQSKLVKLNYKDQQDYYQDPAKIIPHSMSQYVVKYFIDEKNGQLHGIYSETWRDNIILFGRVSFSPSKEAFNFMIDINLSRKSFQKMKKMTPLAMYDNKVYLKGELKDALEGREVLMMYDFEDEKLDQIPLDENILVILSAEVNDNDKQRPYLLMIGSRAPPELVYYFFDLKPLKIFAMKTLNLNKDGPLSLARAETYNDVNRYTVMTDYVGDFFWIELDPAKSEKGSYNVVVQRLVKNSSSPVTEQSDLLKEFTKMPIAQQKLICHHYFEKIY